MSIVQWLLTTGAVGQVERRVGRRSALNPGRRGWRWWSEPRNAVLLVLGAILVVGGGRRLWLALQARRAVARLEPETTTPEAIAAVVPHGRAGLAELFQLLGQQERPDLRLAAGRALAGLWAKDELIAEEEKALVVRGFQVDWHARRRYPRSLQGPIPIEVAYGVSFLADAASEGKGVRTDQLEWSYRILGSRRASLEEYSSWQPGTHRARFELQAGDFETDGPHRLIFHARTRTVGLTGAWELDLPQTTFSFEFDPRLEISALHAAPDAERAAQFATAVRLVESEPGEASAYLPLNDQMALRHPPVIELTCPLPCDLAHSVLVEFEGLSATATAQPLVAAGLSGTDTPAGTVRRPLGAFSSLPADAIERPGRRRMRLRLTPDPHLGWADPAVRSIWPERLETDWLEVEMVRL